jgi:DNA-binding transcriptional LysR family regulator
MAERDADALDWAWLRDFAAVAEGGSLSAAARRLGISQPTLTRRVAALEEYLGSEVLQRGPRGVQLTEIGEAILPAVRRIRDDIAQIELAASGRDAALAGTVRISATEGLANHWCTPLLREFQQAHPGIDIEIDVRNRNANLVQREADIGIRLGRPRQADLVARRVGEVALGLYASADYVARRGHPTTREELAGHACVGYDESIRDTEVGRWIERLVDGGRIVFRANGLMTQLEAIRSGWGIGVTSVFLAREDPRLVRVLEDVELLIELWLVTHPGLRRSARIRAVYDFLAARFEADRNRLAGR